MIFDDNDGLPTEFPTPGEVHTQYELAPPGSPVEEPGSIAELYPQDWTPDPVWPVQGLPRVTITAQQTWLPLILALGALLFLSRRGR